ncbi:MAG TPA: M28 family peptidase [Rheinheimera sp.]|uniref:M28 family peptidase n=1 Tax=Rheinheimera sp. TaxID=1869214 RepID=UPI002F95125D
MARQFCCVLLLVVHSVSAQLLEDIRQLSSADMQGRETGSAGAELARRFIGERYQSLGLASFDGGYQQTFLYAGWQEKTGVNMLAYRQGCLYPQQYIVVSAHYDHLGQTGRSIFYGADDNASGVAALLELAARLSEVCPAYSYIFLATDAEENGLYGSKAFVANPPVALSHIVLNLNLDMIGRAGKRGRLYLTGARRYPALMSQLHAEFSKLQFLPHRGPPRNVRSNMRYNWLEASDHGPFHRAGIPYLFFGGHEHADYHTPEDTWQRIEPDFLAMAMQAIWHTVQWLEQQAPAVLNGQRQ